MTLSPGQVIKERYRIAKLLGEGGMGAVYRAWDMSGQIPCAIKENREVSPEARRQFAREAGMLQNLSHPNLPRVIDFFEEGEQAQFLVMEYIEGDDLRSRLEATTGGLPEAQVIPWIVQVCGALSYLHSQDPPIIHRDIKPANIRITPGGGLKEQGLAVLVDFGVAKHYKPGHQTTVGARAVSPGYSPPEQYGQGVTDALSDVYALGATAYHLLTGVNPPEAMDIVAGIEPPPLPVNQINSFVSQGASQAIEQAIQLNRAARLESAEKFAALLNASGWHTGRTTWELGGLVEEEPKKEIDTRETTVLPRIQPEGQSTTPPYVAAGGENVGRDDIPSSIEGRSTTPPYVAAGEENVGRDGIPSQIEGRSTTPPYAAKGREDVGRDGIPSSIEGRSTTPPYVAAGGENVGRKRWSGWALLGAGVVIGLVIGLVLFFIMRNNQLISESVLESPGTETVTPALLAEAASPSPRISTQEKPAPPGVPLYGWRDAPQFIEPFPQINIENLQKLALIRLWDNPGPTTAAALSRDGNILATGYANGDILVRWVDPGRIPTHWKAGTGPIASLAISEREGLLASAGKDGGVRVWRLETGEPVPEFPGTTEPAAVLTFAPDRPLLAIGGEGISLWQPGTERLTRKPTSSPVNRLAFSKKDDLLVASSANGEVELFKITGNGLRSEWKERDLAGVSSLAFSPDDDFVLIGLENGALFRKAREAQYPRERWLELRAGINSLVFAPNRDILVVGLANGETALIDTRSGTPLRYLDAAPAHILIAGFSREGRVLVVLPIEGPLQVYGVPTEGR